MKCLHIYLLVHIISYGKSIIIVQMKLREHFSKTALWNMQLLLCVISVDNISSKGIEVNEKKLSLVTQFFYTLNTLLINFHFWYFFTRVMAELCALSVRQRMLEWFHLLHVLSTFWSVWSCSPGVFLLGPFFIKCFTFFSSYVAISFEFKHKLYSTQNK